MGYKQEGTSTVKPSLTPKELAQAIGVSESSLKRWADEGMLGCVRTPGGHRRIALAEAINFIRRTNASVVRPDVLGFSDISGPLIGGKDADCPGAALYDALYADDHLQARNVLLSAFLQGRSVAALCDGPIRYAITRIGELWEHEENGIIVEHRATDTIVQALHILRMLMPTPVSDASGALGCAPPGDPYLMPSLMAATVLAEVGFRDLNLGPETPVAILTRAIRHYRPRLVWLAASTPLSIDRLTAKVTEIQPALDEAGSTLIIGGRGVDREALSGLPHVQLCQSMTELACVSRAMMPTATGRTCAGL
jgi:excisionase family DNA binding protein